MAAPLPKVDAAAEADNGQVVIWNAPLPENTAKLKRAKSLPV